MGLAMVVHGHSSQNKEADMDEVETVEVQFGGPSSFALTHMRIRLLKAQHRKGQMRLTPRKEG
jgi:hypothetical protein